MNLRMLGLFAAFGMLVAPLPSDAQQAGKVFRVGLVSIGTDPAQPDRWQAFIEAMRELNYVEGRNLVIKQAFAGGEVGRLPALVADVVGAKVDVIVLSGNREVIAVRRASASIPIVMTYANDPVAQGFAESLARPGGNNTGLTDTMPGINQKYVELLRAAVPSAMRFTVLATPPNPLPDIRRELEAAARALGITVSVAQASGSDEFDGVLAQAKKDGAAGLVVPTDGVTFAYRRALVQLALKHRLPGIYWDRRFVEEGGLMAYSASVAHRQRLAATYVDKILKGAKAGDLPMEQPTKFELIINLKTAKALGLAIPQSLLARADEVID